MKKFFNKLYVKSFCLKAQVAEKLKSEDGSVSDYAWVIIIGIILAGILLLSMSDVIKNEVVGGLKSKVSEFFSFA